MPNEGHMIEFVDICQSIKEINKKCKQLEDKGYLFVGQDDCGCYSSLIYELPEGEYKEDVIRKHKEIVEYCKLHKKLNDEII
jgi:hypothetical protein